MIDPTWRRIAGLHVQNNGEIGVVWLALDTVADVVHLYDCAIFRVEVMAVIKEGIAARGRWIRIAWHKEAKEFADDLRSSGFKMLIDPCADSQSAAEVMSREIWQRMRSSRFRVDQRVGEWLAESRSFYRDKTKIPLDGHPLMSATRHAIEMMRFAKSQSLRGASRKNYPNLQVV